MKGEKTVVRLMEDLKLAREVGRGVLLASNPGSNICLTALV